MELDAPVLRPRGLVVLADERHGLAVALRHQALDRDALPREVSDDRRGAAIGEIEVVGIVAALVGMALDLDELDVGVVLLRLRDVIEELIRARLYHGLVELELDRLERHDRRLRHDHAVGTVSAVDRTGLRAAVVAIRHARGVAGCMPAFGSNTMPISARKSGFPVSSARCSVRSSRATRSSTSSRRSQA